VGGEEVLKAGAIVFGCAALLWAGSARAAPSGVRAPERLTTGSSDELLGDLAPDGRHLYFVSSRSATSQIFAQDLSTGAVAPLFDEAADVSWPRVSPDGKQLLYLSYRDDAAGDLCVRDLARLTRHCLADASTAALEASWLPNGKIALVVRSGLSGDLALEEVTLLDGRFSTRALPGKNLSSPSLSPDGRWLLYVPIAKRSIEVGVGFSARAARTLGLLRLDRPGAPVELALALPGASSQPRFSVDGRWLYFTQYLDDTNLDGVIDGNDHGVLFRIPFDEKKAQPIAADATPEQLTSAAWNCQYPAPARDRLIATCAGSGSLDVYALPLFGAVPEEWSAARLSDELRSNDDPWEELLLDSRLFARTTAKDQRAALTFAILKLHLRLGEYASAEFYAQKIDDAGRAGMRAAVLELIAHRRAERALDRGELSAAFVAEARARIARLTPPANAAPSVAALEAIERSEIADTLGDEADALAELKGAPIDDHTEPFVLGLWAERARAQYRKLDDRRALLEVYRRLAEHPALDEEDRIDYADAFVHELERGRAPDEVGKLRATWLSRVDPDSDLGFMLALEGELLALRPGTSEAVRKGVFDLYRRHRSFEERRALIGETVARAAALDDDYLLYQFANTYVSGISRQSAERGRAEALYRQVVLERAYIEAASGRLGDARGDFFGVTLQTDSPEAHVGFIEARLKEGKDVAAEYAKRYRGHPDDPCYRFARAYLQARRLPDLDDPAQQTAAANAIADLQVARRGLPQSFEIETLWGTILHQRFLRTRDSQTAEAASTHYLLALDLARENPRYRATLYDELGRLQAEVGNFRLALGFLDERDKLPFVAPAAELAHRLTRARCLFHLDRAKDAAGAADGALALLDKQGALARFRPLALDRAALYHLAAGEFAKARALYSALLPLVEKSAGAEGARNRLVAHLGRAAAALGDHQAQLALDDLAAARALLDGPARDAIARPHQSIDEVRASYRLLFSGLGASASRALGKLDEATRALEARTGELNQRLARDHLDEDRLALAIAEAHLAECAHARKDDRQAARHLEAALRFSDDYGAHTGTRIDPVGLALLDAYAALHLQAGVPLAELKLDLPARLQAAYAELSLRRNPDWAWARARFAADLTLLRLDGSK
jgi:hypothetical protein